MLKYLIDCVIVYYRRSGDKSAILANSEGLDNEDKVPCLRVPPLMPADSNLRPHDWKSVVSSTEPQQQFNPDFKLALLLTMNEIMERKKIKPILG